MARPTTTFLWATVAVAGVCCGGLYGSRADAVAAPKTVDGGTSGASPNKNGITAADGSPKLSRPPPDGLEASQTRVNQVDGGPPSQQPPPPQSHGRGGGSADRVAGKDYDGGFAAYNTYGPPRDYYYDERPPEYFGPPPAAQVDGHRGPPGGAVYHQTYRPSAAGHGQLYPVEPHHGGPAEQVRRPGELNIQPLLLPLAGVALLGVLSALVKAPLLLHLGHVGRRRRRDTRASHGRIATAILDEFDEQGRRRRGDLQSCPVCDVLARTYDLNSSCTERSVCEFTSRHGPISVTESDKRLLTAIMAQVLENDQIPETFRKRLRSAELNGKSAANCRKLYPCPANERK